MSCFHEDKAIDRTSYSYRWTATRQSALRSSGLNSDEFDAFPGTPLNQQYLIPEIDYLHTVYVVYKYIETLLYNSTARNFCNFHLASFYLVNSFFKAK